VTKGGYKNEHSYNVRIENSQFRQLSIRWTFLRLLYPHNNGQNQGNHAPSIREARNKEVAGRGAKGTTQQERESKEVQACSEDRARGICTCGNSTKRGMQDRVSKWQEVQERKGNEESARTGEKKERARRRVQGQEKRKKGQGGECKDRRKERKHKEESARTGEKKERVKKNMQVCRMCKEESACRQCKCARKVHEGDPPQRKLVLHKGMGKDYTHTHTHTNVHTHTTE
jgi:hypothetical protein